MRRRPGPCRALVLALAVAGPAADADPMRPLLPPPPPAPSAPVAVAAPLARTRPADAAPTPRGPGRLVAIRTDSDGRRHALLDQRWTVEGDELLGRRVVAIGPHHVDLQAAGGERQRLELLPPLQPTTTTGDPRR